MCSLPNESQLSFLEPDAGNFSEDKKSVISLLGQFVSLRVLPSVITSEMVILCSRQI